MRFCLLLIVILLAAPEAVHAATLDKTEQAAAVSIAARAKAQTGDFKTCAELYHQAWKMDAGERGYLYSAARCEQKAGLLTRADHNYTKYLDGASTQDRLVARARQHRDEVRAGLRVQAQQAARRAAAQRKTQQRKARQQAAAAKAAKAAKVSANLTIARKMKAKKSARFTLGMSSLSGGVVMTAIGGWLMVDSSNAIKSLEEDLGKKQNGQIVGVTSDEANSRQSSANVRLGAGVAMVGVGLAAVGFGTWMLLKPVEQVTLLPRPGGASLLVRF